MKVYPHLFAKLFATPLLLTPATREAFERELLGRMGNFNPASSSDLPSPITRSESATRRMNAMAEVFGSVGIIHINGVIDKGMSDFEAECYGGCDLNDVCNALGMFAADPRIERIVLAINTPGGSATGVSETAARIAAMRDTHEIHAFIDNQCCSAGYWIASQCDWIACAPSAITGSIGVYMALLDQTKALEMDGLKVNLIKAGRLKAMGASFKELTDEERALLQKSCDALYAEFTLACSANRAISNESMQGQSMTGKDALAANVVDELTSMTLDEYVASLLLA